MVIQATFLLLLFYELKMLALPTFPILTHLSHGFKKYF